MLVERAPRTLPRPPAATHAEAVQLALLDIQAVQRRGTRTRRCEDGIKSLGLADGGVAVYLKPGEQYPNAAIEKCVKHALGMHGFKDARVSLVPGFVPKP